MIKSRKSVRISFIVMTTLLIKCDANLSKENGSRIPLEERNLQNKRGAVGDRKNLVVRNTEEFWEEYWKQYDEKHLEDLPYHVGRGKRG